MARASSVSKPLSGKPCANPDPDGQRLTTTGSSLAKLTSPNQTDDPSRVCGQGLSDGRRWSRQGGDYSTMESFAQLRTRVEHGVASATERRQSGFSHRGAANREQPTNPSASSRPKKACGSFSTTSRCEGAESLTERHTVTIPDLMPCRTCRTSRGRHLDVETDDGETAIGLTYRPHHADHPTKAPFSASRATERPWQRACTSR